MDKLRGKKGDSVSSGQGLVPEEKIDMLAATSLLQQKASEIRAMEVNWQTYLVSQMIGEEDYKMIRSFTGGNESARRKIVLENGENLGKAFLNIIVGISKEVTIKYVLVMIDDMIQEFKQSADIFLSEQSSLIKKSPGGAFLNLLNTSDRFTANITASIIARIAVYSTHTLNTEDLRFYLLWLRDELKVHENQYMQSVLRCLQMILRLDVYKSAFIKVDGISTLLGALSRDLNFQLQYQLIFCLWVLTFNVKLAERMNKFNIIPILADILSDSVKEKVTRIILATFRNLIDKPEQTSIAKEHCIAMVQCKVLKQLQILDQRKFDDEDIMDDVNFLNEKLQSSLQDLRSPRMKQLYCGDSFDEYSSELKSGRLEWSPVHRSAVFWRENAMRLNEKNYELLRILLHLLENSRDPLVLSVASYDIGEYVRHYPRGKLIIEHLGGKQLVMSLLNHEDPNVRYEALLAIQKLMVHNWEYLGRRLDDKV